MVKSRNRRTSKGKETFISEMVEYNKKRWNRKQQRKKTNTIIKKQRKNKLWKNKCQEIISYIGGRKTPQTNNRDRHLAIY